MTLPTGGGAIKGISETFRANPAFDAAAAIKELGVGEALVSTLEAGGVPGMVDRTLIRPPESRIGPASAEEIAAVRARSPVGTRYDEALDRESAAEILQARAEKRAQQAEEAEARASTDAKKSSKPRRSSNRQSPAEAAVKSFLRSVSTVLGREISRGILGAIRKGF